MTAVGVRTGVGGTIKVEVTELGGRTVVLVRSDPTIHRGALDLRSSESIAEGAAKALLMRIPLVLVLSSSGADVHDGIAGLHGWGGAAKAIASCSGVVPVLVVVDGPILSGPSLLLGLADVVAMTTAATAYVVGPDTVEAITGQRLSVADLGGSQVHAKHTGVAAAVLADEATALEWLAGLLDHLPNHTDEFAERYLCGDPGDRLTPEAGEILPDLAAGSYDVRMVAAALVDDGYLHELWGGWAGNMVTAVARLDGHAIGILANQPMNMAGTIDIVASQKGARFVDLCDAFNLPILTLVDTPGFFPGKTLEWRGMIRHGAQLVAAFARATTPRLCVVLRKAYGGAYIVMDSRRLGNDVAFAWPTAELAVMGAKQAIEILHRTADEATRQPAQAEYEETLLTPWVAAERGYVDAVVQPEDTRRELAAALDILVSKREHLAAAEPRHRTVVGSGEAGQQPASAIPRHTGEAVPESITITDNRTGDSVEVPILNGGVSADEWRKLLPGVWFHDEALMTTAMTESAITFLDGDEGILRYRGYPIEQLAEHSTYLEVAYLLIHGELPDQAQYDEWVHQITYHTYIHENVRKRFMEGFHYDAHPMGMLVSAAAALSTFYLEAKQIHDPDVRYKQIIRLIAKMPTLAACAHRFSEGMPFVYPDNSKSFTANFLQMMFSPHEEVPWQDPAIARALDVLFIVHAEHEQNCGTTAMRVVGSAHADPYISTASAASALYGPRHGGANEDVIRMLTEIKSLENVDGFIADVKAGKRKLPGFGHRVYKNYDPRAKIIKAHADEVFALTGKNPLLDIALKLEEVALADEYFISRKLYPNVDFYSGLIYQALGFPMEMFTVLFAIPRTVGWLTHWVELLEQDQKIVRPRQLYIGPDERTYAPIGSR